MTKNRKKFLLFLIPVLAILLIIFGYIYLVSPNLPKFAKVSDTLYCGGQPTKKGFIELKEIGIKTIVNLRGSQKEKEKDKLKGLGFKYICIPLEVKNPKDEDIVTFLKVVNNPLYQPVFVHCAQGVVRTGLMVAIYRVYVQNWLIEKAIEELPQFTFRKTDPSVEVYLRNFNVDRIKKLVLEASEPKVEIIE